MSDPAWEKLQELYQQGLDLDAKGRQNLLASVQDQPQLAHEVRLLWENSDDTDPVLEFEALPALTRSFFLQSGRVQGQPDFVDSYQIKRLLAEGGMGRVYEALQKEPIKRTVALKILPAGLKTERFLNRFTAEQRAMGLMSHPNIASVFDAGITGDGLPYFTMEYLPGLPITDFCDRHGLTIEQRIGLFIQVCNGIEHAHQKGVIHRDIKPSNVLVLERDGEGIPKIIDFGVAKLVDEAAAATPRHTRAGTVIGTPGYMSPEQAAGSQPEMVDTRSDVYSLGVLLYELLCGATPLDREFENARSLQSIYRLIQDREPLPPGKRLLAAGRDMGAIAQQRGLAPAKLLKMLGNDLDWVVMKALSKQPGERYPSCSAFRDDLERYRHGNPVRARPSGGLYRLAKFVRKHRSSFLLGSAVLLLFFLAFVLTARALWRATRAETRMISELQQKETVLNFSKNLLNSLNPAQRGAHVKFAQVLEAASDQVAKEFQQQPLLEAETREVLGRSFDNLGQYTRAAAEFERAYRLRLDELGSQHPKTIYTMSEMAWAALWCNDFEQAEYLFCRAGELSWRHLGEHDPLSLAMQSGLAEVWVRQNKFLEAQLLFEDVFVRQLKILPYSDPRVLATQNNLANLYAEKGQFERAWHHHFQIFRTRAESLAPDHPQILSSLHNLGQIKHFQKEYDQAYSFMNQAFQERRWVLGPAHSETLLSLSNLAALVGDSGRFREAVSLLEPSFANALAFTGEDSVLWQGLFLLDQGRVASGDLETLMGQPSHQGSRFLDAFQKKQGAGILAYLAQPKGSSGPEKKVVRWELRFEVHDYGDVAGRLLSMAHNRGNFLMEAGELDQAEAILRDVLQDKRAFYGPNNGSVLRTEWTLAEIMEARGQKAAAKAIFTKLVLRAEENLGPTHRDTKLYRDELLKRP